MSQIPRDYQLRHVEAVKSARNQGIKRLLFTSATGTGKTNTLSWIIADLLCEGLGPVLVVAHTEEIVRQLYERIKMLCLLDAFEIQIEQADLHASPTALVIVASIQTLLSEKRLPNWKPKTIICDEAHHYSSEAWLKAIGRFGAFNGQTLLIGCTATAKRGDKKAIFAYDIAGIPTLTGKDAPKLAHCVFERLVSTYDILDAVEDGFLVPIHGYRVQTQTDISGVKTLAGDFARGELAKKVDNEARTALAIDKWEEVAQERQTIVFCAGVEHAHHAAQMWQERGYSAEAVDGETDKIERRAILARFQSGDIQVLCNMGVFTEGFDAPACSCIVMLRPTKSWPLFVQMAGRGLRPLSGVLNGLNTTMERIAAIQASEKPQALLLDVVDITKNNDLCTAPSVLDLPPDIDLEGESLLETKRLLQKFEAQQGRIIAERPQTFSELKGVLERVELLGRSGANSGGNWRITENGYAYNHLAPGRRANLVRREDGSWQLRISGQGVEMNNSAPSGADLKSIFDYAEKRIKEAWPQQPAKLNRGTWDKLTDKQKWHMARKGHSPSDVNTMTYAYARAKLSIYVPEYQEEKARRFQPRLIG